MNNQKKNLPNISNNSSNISLSKQTTTNNTLNDFNSQEKDLMRFGHTINLINKYQAVLYAGAKGQSSNYEICEDCFLFKIEEQVWIKLFPSGNIPCARAAHSSVSPENNKLYVYGGAVQNGGLAPDILHCLDLVNGINNCYWSEVKVNGPTPGKRYGHTVSYLHPNLFVFGGNLGSKLANDIWCINLEEGSKFEWNKFEINSDLPSPRMYQSFSTCTYGTAKGMLIVFGGRGENNQPTNDIWGFRRHRDGRWDWTKAPYTNFNPLKRFQHTAVFYYNFLIVLGGRTEEEVKETPIQVYDTETSEWTQFSTFNKFRHATWINQNFLYSHGGFDHASPLISKNDLVEIDLVKLLSTEEKFKKKIDVLLELQQKLNTSSSSGIPLSSNSKLITPSLSPSNSKDIMVVKNQNQNFNQGKQYTGSGSMLPSNLNNNNSLNNNLTNMSGLNNNTNPQNNNSMNNMNNMSIMNNLNSINNMSNLSMNNQIQSQNINTKLNKMNINTNYKQNLRQIIPLKEGEISTSNINEGGIVVKKVVLDEKGKYKISNDVSDEPLYEQFIKYLLNPREWIKKKDPENSKFKFKINEIIELTNQATNIIKEQSMVIKVTTPVKVFGDIHGQYIDLMTFFYKWGEPKEGPNGDIHLVDYLFLGDYVDRGTMSLETICLLMALKIKYPNNFHLLRGNHEDRLINSNFGFAEECQSRLGEDPAEEDSVFNLINLFFEYMPLAAVIEDQIFCLHGGIGSSVRKISDLECIPRPLEVVHEATTHQQQTVMDVLWSDPTDFDTELGIQPNTQRDSNNFGNIVKFGPDIVKKFLQDNHLSYIIRAHECVLDGFERFAGGLLITVFSATDYCRRHGNAGAMLIVKTNYEIHPYMIYPPDDGNKMWMDDEEDLKKRPPTPPRIRYNNKGNF